MQLDLFGHDQAPASQPAGGSWSYGLALTMRAVAATPTLHRVLDAAGRAVVRQGEVMNRGPGELLEAGAAELLTPERQAEVLAEAVDQLGDRPVPGLGEVTGLDWVWLGPRQAADWAVTITASRRAVRTWVNLKGSFTLRASRGYDAATTAGAMVAVARGLDLTAPGRRPDPNEACLSWWAGRERLVAGDYFVLASEHDPVSGQLLGLRSQGMLSSVVLDKFGEPQLAWKRHRTRPADIVYTPSDILLPAGWDLNAGFARALLPPPLSPAERRAHALADLLASGAGPEELRAAAS